MNGRLKSKSTYEYIGGATWLDPALEYRRLFMADHYASPKPGGINLNKASIPKVIDEVLAGVKKNIKEWSEKGISDEQKEKIEREARHKAAKLLGSQNPAEIIFGRNTTETISLSYWLAGQYEKEHLAAEVLLSDSENPSVYRATHVNVDNGNRDQKDLLTTYSDLSDPSHSTYKPPDEWIRHSSFNICIFGAYGNETLAEMKGQIEAVMSECRKQPGLMILSHVLRHNGRVMPVKKLVAHAKAVKKHHYPENPELFVCIDGAMALGNLPTCDTDELGCDLYAASPHKTLGSPTLGVGRMNLSSPLVREHLPIMQELQPVDQLLFKRMFDPELNISSNVDEEIDPAALLGFNKTIDYLEDHSIKEGDDFSKTANRRLRIKNYAKKQLASLRESGIPITFTPSQNGSSFILSFNLFGWPEFEPAYLPGYVNPIIFDGDSKEKNVAQMLDKRGIALSFIRRGKIFRISFHWTTTKKEIDEFVRVLREILTNPQSL